MGSKSPVPSLSLPRAPDRNIDALRIAIEQSFRGLVTYLIDLFPGMIVDVIDTTVGGTDVVVKHSVGQPIDNAFPILVRTQGLPGWYLKATDAKTLTITTDGPIDARFWVT